MDVELRHYIYVTVRHIKYYRAISENSVFRIRLQWKKKLVEGSIGGHNRIEDSIYNEQLILEPDDDISSYVILNVFLTRARNTKFIGTAKVHLNDLLDRGAGNKTHIIVDIMRTSTRESKRGEIVVIYYSLSKPCAPNHILDLHHIKKVDVDEYEKKLSFNKPPNNMIKSAGRLKMTDIVRNVSGEDDASCVLAQRPSSSLYRALLIGVSYVNTTFSLRGTYHDVCVMRDLLVNIYHWEEDPQHFRILSDEDPTSEPPTRENIIKSLKWLVQDIQAGDIAFFYFAGHGGISPNPSSLDDGGLDVAVLPLDHQSTGLIVDDVLHEILLVGLPSACRLTAIIDCCNSGSMFDLPFVWGDDGAWKSTTNPYLITGDVQLLSSCLDSQLAYEVVTNEDGEIGGTFTKYISTKLKENPFIPFVDLIEYAQSAKSIQKPQLSSSQRFEKKRSFNLQEVMWNKNLIEGQLLWHDGSYYGTLTEEKPLFTQTDDYDDFVQFYDEDYGSSDSDEDDYLNSPDYNSDVS